MFTGAEKNMYTIGRVVKRFGIARSTLLYYDSIGLLKPSGRSSAGYRLYSEKDVKRLALIMTYRDAGLGLTEIMDVLDSGNDTSVSILEKQLRDLNRDISNLRRQQQQIVRLLKNMGALKKTRAMNKDMWVSILRASGMSDDDMKRWHREFERMAPEAHQDFMESLGIPEREIGAIRTWAAKNSEQSKSK